MIVLYLEWLRLLGVTAERVRFRVHIHESADVDDAAQYWADLVGVPVETFGRATLKHHNPATVRKNTGATYRGCLVVSVLEGATDYRLMEGVWRGLSQAVYRRRAPRTPWHNGKPRHRSRVV